MFRPPDEGREVAFGEIFAGEARADGTATVVDDYRGVVEGFGHDGGSSSGGGGG